VTDGRAVALLWLLVGLAFLIGFLGTLYLQEQARNRRATLLNVAIERLVTCHVLRDHPSDTGFLGWENFIRSRTCWPINCQYYRARQVVIGVAVVLFSVPGPVLLQAAVALHFGSGDGKLIPLLSCLAASVPGFVIMALCPLRRETKERHVLLLRGVKTVVAVVYVTPSIVLSVSPWAISDLSHLTPVVRLANALVSLVGLWIAYLFWSLGSWLADTRPKCEEVADWVERFYVGNLRNKCPEQALKMDLSMPAPAWPASEAPSSDDCD